MLVTPRALLLDFGGVITEGPDGALWTEEVADAVCALLAAEGVAPLPRDTVVARRAGVGAAVLMRSERIERPPHPDGVAPDVVVEDPVELHALLSDHW